MINTTTTINERAQQTASSFTRKGIEGLISHNLNELERLDEFDQKFGEMGAEHRQASRMEHETRLEEARLALRLRKEAGLR